MIYKIPLKSRIALWIYNWLMPTRVRAWAWITAFDELDKYQNRRNVEEHHVDGSVSHYTAVSSIQIEKLRRKLYHDYLDATIGLEKK